MRYSHVALYVDDLRAAERFYTRALAADVLFREAVDASSVWRTLPRRRLPDEAEVLASDEEQIVFADPFEVQWQVRSGAAFRSSGETRGRWFSL